MDSTSKEGRLSDFGKGESALLVGIYFESKEKEKAQEYLNELKSLGVTYGLSPDYEMLVPLRKITAATYLGKGKVEEIAQIVKEHKLSLVVIDEEISPQQQRNLEKAIKTSVIDRTELILGVFAQRAQTKEASIQVRLAKYEYQLPRLAKLWTHLGRQRTGGASGGFLKGEGERQIEIDRRILKSEITRLKKQLEEVKKQREEKRKVRKKNQIPIFALVGYTNAGKSTLLKALTEAEVFIEDKLFATLDTTTRQYKLPSKEKILLTDTVGFIRKLPHHLVASFKSTLEEAAFADVLLHVIDASNPSAKEQGKTTLEVLESLNASKKPILTILNKVDKCKSAKQVNDLKFFFTNSVEISAKEKQGFEKLWHKMEKILSSLRKKVTLRLDQKEYAFFCSLQKIGKVTHSEFEGNDIVFTIELPKEQLAKVKPYLVKRS